MHAIKKTQTILIGFLCAFLLPSLAHAQLPIMFDSNYVSFYLFELDNDTTSVYGRLQYHFVQQIKLIDAATEFQFNKHIEERADKDYCYKLKKPTFAGSHAHLSNDGEVTVFNRNNEPLSFKLNALLDSSWLMYENRRQNTIVKAKIIAVKDSVIFGVVNELKSIQTFFYDTLGNEKKQERFNRFVFLYANNIGFLRLCYLGAFPSTCVHTGYDSCRIFRFAGYQNMDGTIKQGKTFFHLNELHDYEVGDEFHSVDNFDSQYSSRNIKTINRCLLKQEINDSLFFTFKERKHAVRIDRSEPNHKFTDTVEEFEHVVKRPISNARPFNKSAYRENQQDAYSCNTLGGTDQHYWDDHYYFYRRLETDTCFIFLHSNANNISYSYKGVYGYNYSYGPFASGSRQIVYFKKGSKTWGIPLPQNIGLNEIAVNQRANVYPNPASKLATIDVAQVKQVRMVNAVGKLVDITPIIRQNQVEINAEALTNGIYYVELITENGTSRCTLVVEH